MIRVELIRAWPQRCETVAVELAGQATVGDALQAAQQFDAVAVMQPRRHSRGLPEHRQPDEFRIQPPAASF